MRPTEVLSLDEACVDGTLDTFTCLLLVTVVTGTVEETVASLDSIEDSLWTVLSIREDQGA